MMRNRHNRHSIEWLNFCFTSRDNWQDDDDGQETAIDQLLSRLPTNEPHNASPGVKPKKSSSRTIDPHVRRVLVLGAIACS